MKRMGNKTKKPWVFIALGALTGFVLLLVSAGVMAWLIEKGIVYGKASGVWLLVMSFAASFAGTMVGVVTRREKDIMLCLVIIGCILALCLLMGVVLFGGIGSGFWKLALAVLLGGAASCLICLKTTGNKRKIKMPYR